MKTVAKVSLASVVAVLALAAVLVCFLSSSSSAPEAVPVRSTPVPARKPRTIPDAAPKVPATSVVAKTAAPRPARPFVPRRAKKTLPDQFVSIAMQSASDRYDYAALAELRDKRDQIADPELRLELVQALCWFGDTAVDDALLFLKDEDARVVAAASDVIASNVSLMPFATDRTRVYSESLKLMKDTPDREILIDTLKGENASTVISVMHGMESLKDTKPKMWLQLKEAYEFKFDRPYTTYVDALMHFSPRRDD